jgi:uncharacterized protein (TIGR02246 family)
MSWACELMSPDEHAVRELIVTWTAATIAGDTVTVLGLMTEDVVFMVPGRAPFGKAEFTAMAAQMQGVRLAIDNEIVELRVVGDHAYLRSHIHIEITPSGATAPMRRAGDTLTILRKDKGRWLLARDANLVVPQG